MMNEHSDSPDVVENAESLVANNVSNSDEDEDDKEREKLLALCETDIQIIDTEVLNSFPLTFQ